MKTPEEIKQLAIECGMIDYKLGFDTTDQSLQSFYQRAYEEGRNSPLPELKEDETLTDPPLIV